MKTLKTLLFLFIMVGFAVSANSQGKGKQVERPMECSLYAKVVESGGEYETMAITGNANHMGNVAGSMMTFYKPTSTHPPYIEGVLKAANGDCISFYSYPTLIVIDPVLRSGLLKGKMYFTSGTGRFEGCIGEVDMDGVFSMSEDYAMWTAVGTIKY